MFDPLEDELKLMEEIEKNICEKTRCEKLPKALKLKDPIKRIPMRDYYVLPETSTLQTVVDLMREKHIRSVTLVKDDEKVSGIFTTRDVLTRTVCRKLDYEKEMVRDYMTANPQTLRMNDPIAFAMNRMVDGGYRNIPIVDRLKKPIGMISLRSIVTYIADYYYNEVMNLPPKPVRRGTRREGG